MHNRCKLSEKSISFVLQLEHLNAAFGGLRPVAMDVFHLLGYVSLNMAGFRKMLKKYAKNVEPTKPQPGMHQLTNIYPPCPNSKSFAVSIAATLDHQTPPSPDYHLCKSVALAWCRIPDPEGRAST